MGLECSKRHGLPGPRSRSCGHWAHAWGHKGKSPAVTNLDKLWQTSQNHKLVHTCAIYIVSTSIYICLLSLLCCLLSVYWVCWVCFYHLLPQISELPLLRILRIHWQLDLFKSNLCRWVDCSVRYRIYVSAWRDLKSSSWICRRKSKTTKQSVMILEPLFQLELQLGTHV